ncbi:MAG: ATP-binding protein [Rhizobiales bacterium]|nr:ATP-binding protein [Hyphomicrobiales bacterium]
MSEATGPTSAHKELVTSEEFEQAVARLSGFDLDAWFTDSERRAKLVEWLHTGASCPKIVAQLGVKVLAPLVCTSIKATGKWVVQSIAGKVVNQFLAHPNVDKFMDAIEQFAAKMDGQLAAKRAFEAKVLKLSPSTADFRFQLQPELLGQMAQIDALAGIKDDLQKLINKQPKLELPFAGDEEKNRFIYSRRYVPFVGRDNELELLDQFLGSEKGFAWSLVSGPGGMGKSRLALEFVIKKA